MTLTCTTITAPGNFRVNADGQCLPAFPDAQYLVQRREYEDAVNLNERTRGTYLPDNYVPLHQSGQLKLLDGEGEIVPGVFSAPDARAYPRAHMSIRIESRGEHAAFLCDLASLAVHIERLAWMTAFDVEPLVTLETKRRWQQWALDSNALLIFPHDAIKPAGRLTQNENGRLAVQAVSMAYDNPASQRP